jgi:hypothetical protein
LRVGLPYQNKNFIWGDPTRKPETKPGIVISGDMECSGVILEEEDEICWDSMSEDYQEYLEKLYERWMLPHHEDLRNQGCKIYTGKYTE